MRLVDLIEGEGPLKWASGGDVGQAIIKYRQKDPEYTVVTANIRDLFDKTWPSYALDIDDPRGGRNAIGDRIGRAKAHWTSGGYMDPAEISIQVDQGEPAVVWQDGRHRLAAAHQMGHEYGQVVVPKKDLPLLRKMVRTIG